MPVLLSISVQPIWYTVCLSVHNYIRLCTICLFYCLYLSNTCEYLQRCDHCNYPRASICCQNRQCSLKYHFHCALLAECVLLKNNQVFCSKHATRINPEMVLKKNDVQVKRFVYVDMNSVCLDKPGTTLLEVENTKMQIGE